MLSPAYARLLILGNQNVHDAFAVYSKKLRGLSTERVVAVTATALDPLCDEANGFGFLIGSILTILFVLVVVEFLNGLVDLLWLLLGSSTIIIIPPSTQQRLDNVFTLISSSSKLS